MDYVKKYTIAIPQDKKMQDAYENGWEIETKTIEDEKLLFDDLFEVYVKNIDDTEYIDLNSEIFHELNTIGVWNSLNQFATYGSIEDYEEGDIKELQQMQNAYSYLKSINNTSLSKESKKIIDNIINLIEKAIQKNVGIYFFF